MTNPNNCAACKHKEYPDGGWCYMFRLEPTRVCAHHTKRTEMLKASPIFKSVVTDWLRGIR